MDEGKEAKVGDVGGRGKEDLDYHIVGTTSGDTREDEVGGNGDEDA